MAPGLRHLVFRTACAAARGWHLRHRPRQLFVDQAAGDVFRQESREGAAGGRARDAHHEAGTQMFADRLAGGLPTDRGRAPIAPDGQTQRVLTDLLADIGQCRTHQPDRFDVGEVRIAQLKRLRPQVMGIGHEISPAPEGERRCALWRKSVRPAPGRRCDRRPDRPRPSCTPGGQRGRSISGARPGRH